ncbi:head decoration protein [Rhizobium sp. NPDC090275]|uniref:head decoration protein n=1 Tax=Rhizobium sp. NPDC090275 TaxID=3364498 RepID=UPI00383AFD19
MIMPTTLTETPRDLAFILSEANRHLSRDVLTIKSGSGKVFAGTILGKVTADGKYVPSPAASTTGKEGAETASAILGYEVDATSADVQAVCITNNAEVKKPMLIFETTVNDETKKAAKLTQLRSATIKAR